MILAFVCWGILVYPANMGEIQIRKAIVWCSAASFGWLWGQRLWFIIWVSPRIKNPCVRYVGIPNLHIEGLQLVVGLLCVGYRVSH